MAPLRELMRSLGGGGGGGAAALLQRGAGGGVAAAAGLALRTVTYDDFAAAVAKLRPTSAAS